MERKQKVKKVISILFLVIFSRFLFSCSTLEETNTEDPFISEKYYNVELLTVYKADNVTHTCSNRVSKRKGETINLTLYNEEVDGFYFEGWYYDTSYRRKVLDEDSFIVTKNLTLYGHLVSDTK